MAHSIFEYVMTEYWKDVKGYEGLYQVSNLGNIRNSNTGRVLKTRKHRDGYVILDLYKNGKMKTYKLHRLVAQAFIPNPDNLPCVNHKDEDKVNNFVGTPENKYTDGNLEWCTHEYNTNYGTRNEKVAKTMTNGKNSKTVLQLGMDGSLVRIWPSVSEVERQLGYSCTNISTCCRGKQHSSYGFRWSYIPLHDPLSDE